MISMYECTYMVCCFSTFTQFTIAYLNYDLAVDIITYMYTKGTHDRKDEFTVPVVTCMWIRRFS